MTPTSLPLTTPRLTLRLVEEADLDTMWAYRSLPDVRMWLGGSHDRDQFRQKFLEPADGRSQLAVVHDGVVIGDLMLDVQDAWSQGEVAEQARATQGLLGWTIHPDLHGRGLGSEAVTELVRHCFEDLGLRRVVAECFADNDPSWRLMERIGMRREAHHVKDSLHRDLGWQDEFVYALLAEEWQRRQTV